MRLPFTARHSSVLIAVLALVACGGAESVPLLGTTSPLDGATQVALNAKLTAPYDVAMTPLTSTSFTLKRGTEVVAGVVTMSADAKTATFTPTAELAASTLYRATLTGVKSAGGVMAAERSWTFTTGTTTDAVSPVLKTTSPRADVLEVAINARILATFDKTLDPQSVTTTTFTVTQSGALVPGLVTTVGSTASFTPTASLPLNTRITATLTTGVKDLQGNALAAAFTWSFTTGTSTARGPSVVSLGTAGDYVVLAKTAVSSVPASSLTGDVGLGPAAASYVTGFSLVADASNVFSTSPQVVGRVFAADYAVPTPTVLTTAVSDMEAAYVDAAGRPTPDFLELGTGNLGGRTLSPGLYTWTSSVTVPTDVTLSGSASDVWILQTTGDLDVSAAKRVTLTGGALAKNVFWQVAGRVTLGATSHFEGIVLCKTDVTLETGATMNGRVLAQSQVALQQATVTQPAP
jgi:hypothetical protein